MRRLLVVMLCSAALASTGLEAQDPERLLRAATNLEMVDGNLTDAIAQYRKVAASGNRVLAAQALVRMAECYVKLGDAQADAVYAEIVRDYADQKDAVAIARARLPKLAGPAAPPGTRVQVEQLWAGDDVNLSGLPSPDGRLLTFVDWSAGSGNIAIRNLVTGETRQLTHATTSAEGRGEVPVLSADAGQVAYVWYSSEGPSLRVISVDEPKARVLVQGVAPYWGLRWSPDSRHVAAILEDGGSFSLALVSVANGSVTQLKSTGWRVPQFGGFSPDGRYLLYSLSKSTRGTPVEAGGIYLLQTDAARESVLVEGKTNDSSPAWSADGTSVVFLSDRSGQPDLWSVSVAGGKPAGAPQLVRSQMAQTVNMGFDRSGNFYYGTRNDTSDVYICDIDPVTLRVTAAPRLLSEPFQGAAGAPSWSPDGRQIAFVRGRPRDRKIIIRDVQTGDERALPTAFVNSHWLAAVGPTWFADGRAVLVPDQDWAKGQASFRRIDVSSGQESLLLQKRADDIHPLVRVSPDGRTLYFALRERVAEFRWRLRLIRRDIASEEETELYASEAPGFGLFGLALSPDGRTLAFTENVATGKYRLMTIPVSGGASRELYRASGPRALDLGLWTRDGQYILGAGADNEHQQRVWAFPAAGGDPRKLDLTMPQFGSGDLSPDGRHLVVTGVRASNELWRIKNLLQGTPGAAASK